MLGKQERLISCGRGRDKGASVMGGSWRGLGGSYVMPLGGLEKGEGLLQRDTQVGTTAGRRSEEQSCAKHTWFWFDALIYRI